MDRGYCAYTVLNPHEMDNTNLMPTAGFLLVKLDHFGVEILRVKETGAYLKLGM